jgi:hypothetical protein
VASHQRFFRPSANDHRPSQQPDRKLPNLYAIWHEFSYLHAMRLIVLTVLIFLFFSTLSFAQSAGGSWYGKADALLEGSHNNYLTELILKQKGDEVEGVFGYYYRDGYKSLFVRGKYNKNTRQFVIRQIPLTYFRSPTIDGVDCIMDFHGTIMVSKVQSTIKGRFVSYPKYKHTCPEITVSYTLDMAEKNQDSLIKNSVARKLWQPQKEDVVITNTSVATPTPDPVIPDTASARKQELQNLIEVFEQRKTVLSKEIIVASDSVRISFYDNGDIDGDSISVFLNKIPIITKQVLNASAFNVYIKLDSAKDVNEVSMFADNLGKIPPNTALMVVNDGEQRHEIYLSSSLTQNSSVRLRKRK